MYALDISEIKWAISTWRIVKLIIFTLDIRRRMQTLDSRREFYPGYLVGSQNEECKLLI